MRRMKEIRERDGEEDGRGDGGKGGDENGELRLSSCTQRGPKSSLTGLLAKGKSWYAHSRCSISTSL